MPRACHERTDGRDLCSYWKIRENFERKAKKKYLSGVTNSHGKMGAFKLIGNNKDRTKWGSMIDNDIPSWNIMCVLK